MDAQRTIKLQLHAFNLSFIRAIHAPLQILLMRDLDEQVVTSSLKIKGLLGLARHCVTKLFKPLLRRLHSPPAVELIPLPPLVAASYLT